MADDLSRLARLLRWCGMALVAGGMLMVVATLLHPSRETATTIVASELRLVAAHVAYTMAWLLVLLGLPGLYAAQRGGMGRLGLVGFLTAFSGTYLIAVTGNFGFLAPVLAKQSPAVLDSISRYSPVVVVNGLAAVLFMIGYVLFGIAMIRTATLRRGELGLAGGRRRGCGTKNRRAGQMAPSDHNGVFAKLRPEALSRFWKLGGASEGYQSDPRCSRATALMHLADAPSRRGPMV